MNIKQYDWFKIPDGVRIPYLGGKLYWELTKKENEYICSLDFGELGLYRGDPREYSITVSLTSFPARINTVEYAIKTLLHQTIKPDRIILWLADTQLNDSMLPQNLKDLQNVGLDIRYVDDLGSHKKYHYALQQQGSKELVITYDDDLLYPEDSIERLITTYSKYPNCIVCNRAMTPTVRNGSLGPYSTWRVHTNVGVNCPSSILFPSTGGGTLYPYGSVNSEAFNLKSMRRLAFTADDLWMRFMSALNGTNVIKTHKNHKTFSVIQGSQQQMLATVNIKDHGNDETISRLSSEYPSALREIVHIKY